MKSLVEFIHESLLKDKVKDKFVLVEPTNKAWDELSEEMADAMLSNNSDADLFVLTIDAAQKIYNKYPDQIFIYKIPGGDLDKFESDYEDGKFVYDELEEIDLNN